MRGLVLAGLLFAAGHAIAQAPAEVAGGLAQRVQELRATLSEEQAAHLTLPFEGDLRFEWTYLPGERKGVSIKQLDADQRVLLEEILKVALSESGYATIGTIRGLEQVLREMEGSAHRDSELYYLALFGEPHPEAPWGLRFEGHHISLNWTVAGGKVIATTPQFLGANPGEVRQGALKGTRALAAEEDLGRSLAASLDEAQRATGVIDAAAPADILSARDREAAIQEDKGIAYTALNTEQQGMLSSLIEHYARLQAAPLAEDRLRRLREAGLDEVKFAWMGGLAPGQGHYYRVQGPTFLIEYDNTQNDANHVHTVWRDFKGDFGLDLLKAHYQQHANAGDSHGHHP